MAEVTLQSTSKTATRTEMLEGVTLKEMVQQVPPAGGATYWKNGWDPSGVRLGVEMDFGKCRPPIVPKTSNSTTPNQMRVELPNAKNVGGGRNRKRPTEADLEDIDDAIARKFVKSNGKERVKVKTNHAQHYLDFCFIKRMHPLIKDPLNVKSHNQLKQWIGYGVEYHGIRCHSVNDTTPAIDDLHIANKLLPPFKYATIATKYLNELMREDAPAQPRLPMPPQAIEHWMLESDDPGDYDTVVECAGMSTGLH